LFFLGRHFVSISAPFSPGARRQVIEELAREYEAALDAAGVPYGDADAALEDAEGAEAASGMEVILEEDEESLELERYSGDGLAAQATRAKRLSRDDAGFQGDKKTKPRGRQKSADEVIRSAKGGSSRALSPAAGGPTGAASLALQTRGLAENQMPKFMD